MANYLSQICHASEYMQDQTSFISDAVKQASRDKRSIRIIGGDSKCFYGSITESDLTLDVSTHRGIIDYEPAELFITARAGTPLQEIESELSKHQQMLPFEPPYYGEHATLGGTIACGFSGPRRPYAGAARDGMLGTHIINGQGDYLKFGGQVMKNVAGYDVSRAMCGALGTLGVIMQVSLKVLPKPQHETSVKIEASDPLSLLLKAFQSALPLSASYAENNDVYLRVNTSFANIKNILSDYQIEEIDDGGEFWLDIKEQRRNFFNTDLPVWRISVPANTPSLPINGETVTEWNGGLRWIKTMEEANNIHQIAEQYRGHATLFRTPQKNSQRFNNLTPALKQLHLNLKHAFDPQGILNRGRMYEWC